MGLLARTFLHPPTRGRTKLVGSTPAYFCDCETPQPDGLYQCETCYRLVYRDDY